MGTDSILRTVITVGLISVISFLNVVMDDDKFTVGLVVGFLVGISTVFFAIMF